MEEQDRSAEPRKLSQLAVGSILMPLACIFLLLSGEVLSIPDFVPVWPCLVILLLLPLAGLVMSVLAWSKINKSEGALRGKGLAAVGFVANLIIYLGLWILPTLASGGYTDHEWAIPPLALIAAGAAIGLACSVHSLLNVLHAKEKTLRKRYALVGVTLSALTILACLGVMMALAHVTQSHRTNSCLIQLKQLGLILDLYATENEGELPPVDDTKNNFTFEGSLIYPEYLTDASILVCTRSTDYQTRISRLQGKPDCITDDSYIYVGCFITSDAEAEEFFRAYDRLAPQDNGKDILDPEDSSVLFRKLRGRLAPRWREQDAKAAEERIKTLLGSDAPPSEIPIMWERPYTDVKRFNHERPGGYVLYLDGSVDFVEYGEKFPMTETMARLLDERPRAPIPDCEEDNE
ncbi:MAG: hypothetical protein C4532_01410 [Candidatus Abyssobacteria bacterium SURF_17]|jgi:hypothetical protein|uniref:Uncharacterized protein n=1 Tax=Candidatus Abyssobacteria bacterium SURF_17 TaxID=2093361 RepID=A0A419F8N3_9BACT|nr:MAG: hypothetical protein C4532_01410 [Candidatus Abyssubacteria bacterium SURF_17]